jgi:hypothetical protein
MVIFPEGHSWTESEREELIIKLKITPDEAQKLIESEKKTVDKEVKPLATETSERGLTSKSEPDNIETVRLRQYRVRLEDLNFDPGKTNEEQDFSAKVFESDLMEKK